MPEKQKAFYIISSLFQNEKKHPHRVLARRTDFQEGAYWGLYDVC